MVPALVPDVVQGSDTLRIFCHSRCRSPLVCGEPADPAVDRIIVEGVGIGYSSDRRRRLRRMGRRRSALLVPWSALRPFRPFWANAPAASKRTCDRTAVMVAPYPAVRLVDSNRTQADIGGSLHRRCGDCGLTDDPDHGLTREDALSTCVHAPQTNVHRRRTRRPFSATRPLQRRQVARRRAMRNNRRSP
jgi:hypothetical protein